MNNEEIKNKIEDCEIEYERLKIKKIRLLKTLSFVEDDMEKMQKEINNLKDILEQRKFEDNTKVLDNFLKKVNNGEFNKGNIIVKGKKFNLDEASFIDYCPLVVFTIIDVKGEPIVRQIKIDLKSYSDEILERRLKETVIEFVNLYKQN